MLCLVFLIILYLLYIFYINLLEQHKCIHFVDILQIKLLKDFLIFLLNIQSNILHKIDVRNLNYQNFYPRFFPHSKLSNNPHFLQHLVVKVQFLLLPYAYPHRHTNHPIYQYSIRNKSLLK